MIISPFPVLTPPPATWSEWGDWIETDPSSCSCGMGFKIRFRNCPAPSPDACDGDQTQTEPCTASDSTNQQTCERPSGLTSGRFQWVSSPLNFWFDENWKLPTNYPLIFIVPVSQHFFCFLGSILYDWGRPKNDPFWIETAIHSRVIISTFKRGL